MFTFWPVIQVLDIQQWQMRYQKKLYKQFELLKPFDSENSFKICTFQQFICMFPEQEN